MISRFFIELNENLYLLFPFFENAYKMGQEIRAFQTEQRFDRAFTVRFDHAKAAVQSQNVDKRGLALFPVRADGFAEGLFIAHHIEHIVADLESNAEVVGVADRGFLLLLGAARGSHTHQARRANERARLAQIDLLQLRCAQCSPFPCKVELLTAADSLVTGGICEELRALECARRGNIC